MGDKSEPLEFVDDNESPKRFSRDSEGNAEYIKTGGYSLNPCTKYQLEFDFHSGLIGETTRVTTPTAIESSLPWKRVDDDGDGDGGAVKQNEFPAWASNKEYIAYNSPSATFLGMRKSGGFKTF